MKKEKISTGIEYLDVLLDYLHIGDNVVWEAEAGTYIDVFVEKLISNTLKNDNKLIYISFNKSPLTITKRLEQYFKHGDITLLDCFTSGKGNNDPTFTNFYDNRSNVYKKKVIKVENPSNIKSFQKILNEIEEEKGKTTRYVFDSLTGMQDLWESEQHTYKFFTYSCPRLYDLKTIAYWILEKEAHSSAFRANLRHVTQIAIELSRTDIQLFLKVAKADGRVSKDLFRAQKYEVWDGEIVFPVVKRRESIDLGSKIKILRMSRNMSQRELAERIGATASFISQVERNIISPSISSLIQLSVELKIDPVCFFSQDENSEVEKMIFRKSQREDFALPGINSPAIKAQTISKKTYDRKLQSYLLTFEPNAEIKKHFYLHKGEEFFYVLKGTIEVEIDGKKHTLYEGDTLYLDSRFPDLWKNISDIPVQLIWILKEK